MKFKIHPDLDQATASFINAFLGVGATEEALSNGDVAKNVIRAITAFHEGAFWAAARISQEWIEHPEFVKDGPHRAALEVVIQIMAEHSKARELFTNAIESQRH